MKDSKHEAGKGRIKSALETDYSGGRGVCVCAHACTHMHKRERQWEWKRDREREILRESREAKFQARSFLRSRKPELRQWQLKWKWAVQIVEILGNTFNKTEDKLDGETYQGWFYRLLAQETGRMMVPLRKVDI